MAAEKYAQWSTASQMILHHTAIDSSAGAGDAGKIPALDATGKLDSSMIPAGTGTDSDAQILAWIM